MSADVSTERARGSGRRVPGKLVVWVLVALVLVAMVLDTTFQDADQPIAGASQAFDRDAFGAENFPRATAEIKENAVDLTTLVPALQDDVDAASEQYGRRQGQSPYNFPVRGEGVAGTPENGLLPIEVEGLDDTTVSLQIGPAINGTSLRDVVSFISFDQFVNQVDYADAATALNTQVKERVLQGFDPAAAEGKRVAFTGAFTLLAPTAITVTPVELEVAG